MERKKTCKNCCEEFGESMMKRPRALSCDHSFCHQCIAKFISSESKSCPTCQETISYEKVQHVPVNYSLLSKGSEDTQAQDEVLIQDGRCLKHFSPNYFYCNQCGVALCGTCVLLKHKTCTTKKVNDVFNPIIENNLKYIEENLAIIQASKQRRLRLIDRMKNLFECEDQNYIQTEDLDRIKDLYEEMKFTLKTSKDVDKIMKVVNDLKKFSQEFDEKMQYDLPSNPQEETEIRVQGIPKDKLHVYLKDVVDICKINCETFFEKVIFTFLCQNCS